MRSCPPLFAFCALTAACSADPGSNPEEGPTGTAVLEVATVPPDALCLVLNIEGGFSTQRKLTLTPGQSANFTVTGLPLGSVDFVGNVYNLACSSVTATSSATWSADPVVASLSPSTTPLVKLFFHRNTGRVTVGIDFDDGGVPKPCNLASPFGPSQLVGFSSFTATRSGGRLSPDELTIYLSSSSDLYSAPRPTRSDLFAMPRVVSGVNSGAQDGYPSVSANGLALFFDSLRSGVSRIYSATRTSTQVGFGAPSQVTAVDTVGATAQPYLAVTGNLYFASDLAAGNGQIYFAPKSGSTFSTPIALAINSGFNERAPVVSADELTLFFATNRTDGGSQGGFDIWTSRRPDLGSPFASPTNEQELNSFEDEQPTWISPDGCRLYFSRGQGMYFAERPR